LRKAISVPLCQAGCATGGPKTSHDNLRDPLSVTTCSQQVTSLPRSLQPCPQPETETPGEKGNRRGCTIRIGLMRCPQSAFLRNLQRSNPALPQGFLLQEPQAKPAEAMALPKTAASPDPAKNSLPISSPLFIRSQAKEFESTKPLASRHYLAVCRSYLVAFPDLATLRADVSKHSAWLCDPICQRDPPRLPTPRFCCGRQPIRP
jgi:hypothetical protein